MTQTGPFFYNLAVLGLFLTHCNNSFSFPITETAQYTFRMRAWPIYQIIQSRQCSIIFFSDHITCTRQIGNILITILRIQKIPPKKLCIQEQLYTRRKQATYQQKQTKREVKELHLCNSGVEPEHCWAIPCLEERGSTSFPSIRGWYLASKPFFTILIIESFLLGSLNSP